MIKKQRIKRLEDAVGKIDEGSMEFTQAKMIDGVYRSEQFSFSEVIYAILDHLGIELERKREVERVFAKKK